MPGLSFNPEQDIPDLSGKVILITGGTGGLGAESAFHLAKHSLAHIYVSGRNAKNANAIIDQVRDTGSRSPVSFLECDLSSLTSVNQATQTLRQKESRLDILMCNAGIMASPAGLTQGGYEIQFGTNHLGHALLIKKCLPLLQRTGETGGDARIIILSSSGYRMHAGTGIQFDSLKTKQDCKPFGPWIRYGQRKLANILYARELAHRYPDITTVSIHPGVVNTALVGNLTWGKRAFVHATTIGKRLEPFEGAYNQIWAATTAKENVDNGQMYDPVGVLCDRLDQTARDDGLAQRLWEWTDQELRSYVTG